MVSELIDTTEMYLRTIFELEEEGIVPLRARIAERLHQSGPTVSQTVARMERDGLVTVEGDRQLLLSEKGRALATRVMRKHRLAERLLTDIIGLEIELTKTLSDDADSVRFVIRRIAEELQKDTEAMSVLRRVGALPGNDVLVSRGHNGVVIARLGETAELDKESAAHLFVSV